MSDRRICPIMGLPTSQASRGWHFDRDLTEYSFIDVGIRYEAGTFVHGDIINLLKKKNMKMVLEKLPFGYGDRIKKTALFLGFWTRIVRIC